ncbi:MAG TPA: hypothetical protein VIM16_15815 [Mucilaginibacter sp.]|jgi:hypothetical protein
MSAERKPLTSEQTVEILKKHGSIVTIKEAEEILVFLRNLAELTLEQYFNRNDDGLNNDRTA